MGDRRPWQFAQPTGSQYNQQLASDGSGGTIITWQDYRRGSSADIYAQRPNAAGVPQWATDGVAICTATMTECRCVSSSDGSGGAIIAWQDYRSGTNYDIYAQRVNSSGVVQWRQTVWQFARRPIHNNIHNLPATAQVEQYYNGRTSEMEQITISNAQNVDRNGQLGLAHRLL